jgi:hypothetical protein
LRSIPNNREAARSLSPSTWHDVVAVLDHAVGHGVLELFGDLEGQDVLADQADPAGAPDDRRKDLREIRMGR